MKAIVNVPICALLAAPTRESTLEDEALYGMVVDILEEPAPGWYRVRTHYRYEGIVSADDLIVGDEAADAWAALPKKIVRNKNFCDVLSAPKVQGWIMATLPRGGILSPVGQPEKGWQQVRLADGRTGFVPESILGEYHTAPLSQDEETLRQALVDAAMLYQGTHYRWGGKSPMGIDCSGLVSTAYMLCGILIYPYHGGLSHSRNFSGKCETRRSAVLPRPCRHVLRSRPLLPQHRPQRGQRLRLQFPEPR